MKKMKILKKTRTNLFYYPCELEETQVVEYDGDIATDKVLLTFRGTFPGVFNPNVAHANGWKLDVFEKGEFFSCSKEESIPAEDIFNYDYEKPLNDFIKDVNEFLCPFENIEPQACISSEFWVGHVIPNESDESDPIIDRLSAMSTNELIGEKSKDDGEEDSAVNASATASPEHGATHSAREEQLCLESDATAGLAEFFGIDLENPDDAEENPGAWQKCEDFMGASFDELTNAGGDKYIIDKLVEGFRKLENADSGSSDVWNTVILDYIANIQKPKD